MVVGVSLIAIMGAQCQPPKPPPTPGPGTPGTQPPVDPCQTPAAGLSPFTQDELDNNWVADRTFPTGDVQSVSFEGCDDVAEIGIDSSQTATGAFFRTEGIKTLAGNFGNAVQINLYLDPAWQDTAVRAGLWVAGDDGGGGNDDLFGIIEFVNIEPTTSGDPAFTDDHEGWRIWDTELDAWTDVTTASTYGEWATLRIELDTVDEEYDYFINGEFVGSRPGGENFIREVFVNQYNFGLHGFDNLGTDSYSAHWYAGV